MLRNRFITICQEGWYYLIVLGFIVGGAILREINLLYLLTGMLIGVMVLNARFVLISLRRLEVRRKLPDGVCAGDLLIVEIQATNRRKRLASWEDNWNSISGVSLASCMNWL